MEKADIAKEAFQNGFHCVQAVLSTPLFAGNFWDKDTAYIRTKAVSRNFYRYGVPPFYMLLIVVCCP